MSAFSKAAIGNLEHVTGLFGIATLNPAQFRPEVSAGLKQVRHHSFGNEPAPANRHVAKPFVG